MTTLELLPAILGGLRVTLLLTVGGAVLATVAAWFAGLGKLSHWRAVRYLAGAYVEVFRGTSALVQLYWFFYALPLLGVSLPPLLAGIVVLGLNIGAYGAEVVRGSIIGIDNGQYEAALALDMTPWQRLRIVIVPQAVARMLPPAGNLLIELLKSTALVSLITLSDLTFRGMLVRAETLRTAEVFGILLLIYFVLGQSMVFGTRALERRLTARWRMGPSQ